jgi:hypothetical protein
MRPVQDTPRRRTLVKTIMNLSLHKTREFFTGRGILGFSKQTLFREVCSAMLANPHLVGPLYSQPFVLSCSRHPYRYDCLHCRWSGAVESVKGSNNSVQIWVNVSVEISTVCVLFILCLSTREDCCEWLRCSMSENKVNWSRSRWKVISRGPCFEMRTITSTVLRHT